MSRSELEHTYLPSRTAKQGCPASGFTYAAKMPAAALTPQQQYPRGPWNGLHFAAYNGCIQRAVALLGRGSLDINQRTPGGYTALLICAREGHPVIARILLNKGADMSITDDEGFTALLTSAYRGHLAVTTLLVEAGSALEATTPSGHTCLHLAAQEGHIEVTTALMKAGSNLQVTTLLGLTPLHSAADNGHEEAVAALVKAGAGVHAKTSCDSTPLHFGAHNGFSRIVRILLDNGADSSMVDEQGFTPLHYSGYNGHLAVTNLLVEAGSALEATTPSGHTCLHLAAQNGHFGVTTALLQFGADVQAKASLGHMPLHLAAQNGHLDVVAALVEAGSSVHATVSFDGSTALHMAAYNGHVEAVKALIDSGAFCDARGLNGSTPLFCAAGAGYLEVVRVLLRAQANPLLTRTDPHTRTSYVPLDAAAFQGYTEVVHELVRQLGVEGCGGTSGGVDALCLAAEKQHVDIMAFLVRAGVVDTGEALRIAAAAGQVESMKSLLQQHQNKRETVHGPAYVNARDDKANFTPLWHALCRTSCSPRVVRLLVDAGADTTSAARLIDMETGEVVLNETPLCFTTYMIRERSVAGCVATEEQIHRLEGVRRLLLQVEAARAESWLWHNDVPNMWHIPESSTKTKIASAPLKMMVPALRRRARRRRGVLLRAVFRPMVTYRPDR